MNDIVCVLGLDLATHCGLAIAHGSDTGVSIEQALGLDCSIRTTGTKTIEPDPLGKRFHLLREHLKGFIGEWKFDAIFIEDSVGGPTAGGPAAAVSMGMRAIVQELGFSKGIEVYEVATGTLKKHATGNGGHATKKPHMIAACLVELDTNLPENPSKTKARPWIYDDNAADAVWLAHLGCIRLLAQKWESKNSYEGEGMLAVKVRSRGNPREAYTQAV